jgi:hypothetical protein
MKRKYFTLLIIIILILLLFGLYWFKIRRTAYTVAHVITGMEISNKYKIEIFQDEWLPNGDGENLIIFSITKDQLLNLINLCKINGFKKLPIKGYLPDNTIYSYLDNTDSLGYYKLKLDKTDFRNYELFVITEKNKKFIIYNVVY